jgi:hypothetical protein
MIISFIITLFIYKVAFNLGWGRAFIISILVIIIEIILISIVYTMAELISIVNTPVGTLRIRIDHIITYFMSGLILSTILIYLAAKFSKINISFLEALVVNMFSGAISFIIIITSILLYILEENIVAFSIGGVLAFILALIIYKYILNASWKKVILMSITVSVLLSIIGLTILSYYIYFMAYC